MISKKQIVKFLHLLAETMEIPPHQLAAAALEYANGVFGGADGSEETEGAESEVLETHDTAQDPDFPAASSSEPYTGSISASTSVPRCRRRLRGTRTPTAPCH